MSSAAPLPDVIVIGAGVIGLATAFELLAAGRRVTVLERGSVGPGGASWAGGGILAPLAPDELDDALLPMLRDSLDRYAGWCARLHELSGIDPEFDVCGIEIQAPADGARWHRLAAACAQPIEAVGSGTDLFLPTIAQVRSPRLLRALAGAVSRSGGVIVEGTSVTGLDGGDRVTAVRTANGSHPCGAVVLAAGAWSTGLWPASRIEPVKGQMLQFRAAPGLLRRMLMRDGFYLVPRRDGTIIAGSTLERVGFDTTPTPEARAAILEGVRHMAPDVAACPIEAHWAGLRPAPAGALPWVGTAPDRQGLFLNCGHYRLGITLAPGSARRLAACW